MNNLSEAELMVDTRFSIESGNNNGNWFYLNDYYSLEEFFADCASWFSDEENPDYVYRDWQNIPDCMINENWISPNIFEVKDALQSINEAYTDVFFEWCKTYGWDIANDDPQKIVSEFHDAMEGLLKSEDDQYCGEDDEYVTLYSGPRINCEMFTDDYN